MRRQGRDSASTDSKPPLLHQNPGVVNGLPVFYTQAADRLDLPQSWLSDATGDFDEWRPAPRSRVVDQNTLRPKKRDNASGCVGPWVRGRLSRPTVAKLEALHWRWPIAAKPRPVLDSATVARSQPDFTTQGETGG